jgi:hypothetical protein
MRFEYIVLIFQLFSLGFIYFRFNSRVAIVTLVIFTYGPAASLVKIDLGPVVLPLGIVIALCGILYTLKTSLYRPIFYYISGLILASVTIAILQFNMYIFLMTIHYLIYAVCGLMMGNFVGSRPYEVRVDIIKGLLVFSALSLCIVIFFRMFLVDGTGVIHSRDVGFGLIPIFIVFLSLSGNKVASLPLISSLSYIALSQTRSITGILLITFIYGKNLLGFSNKNISYILLVLMIVSSVALLVVTRYEARSLAVGSELDVTSLLSLESRLNGAIIEWETFKSNPFFGEGIRYYNEANLEYKKQEKLSPSTIVAVAYNHVGVVSVLAQGGVLLFLLTLAFPLYLVFRVKKPVWASGDKLLISCYLILIAYLISFLISGSPVRRDYNDSIFYYFVIGYIMRCWRDVYYKKYN